MAYVIHQDYTLGKLLKARAALAQTQIVGGPVGEPASYAAFLEFGTRNTPPRPFLRPAASASRAFAPILARAALNRYVKTGRLNTNDLEEALAEAIRAMILSQGLVKTGALLASIQAKGA